MNRSRPQLKPKIKPYERNMDVDKKEAEKALVNLPQITENSCPPIIGGNKPDESNIEAEKEKTEQRLISIIKIIEKQNADFNDESKFEEFLNSLHKSKDYELVAILKYLNERVDPNTKKHIALINQLLVLDWTGKPKLMKDYIIFMEKTASEPHRVTSALLIANMARSVNEEISESDEILEFSLVSKNNEFFEYSTSSYTHNDTNLSKLKKYVENLGKLATFRPSSQHLIVDVILKMLSTQDSKISEDHKHMEMARVILWKMFSLCDQNTSPKDQHSFFLRLLSCCDNKGYLKLTNSKLTLYPLLYACVSRPVLYEYLIDWLLRKFGSLNNTPLDRESAVSFLGELMGKAKFVPINFVLHCLERVCLWIHQYIDNHENSEKRVPIIAHQVFYRACYMVFSVIAERQHELNNNQMRKSLEILNLDAIVASKLKPIAMCHYNCCKECASIQKCRCKCDSCKKCKKQQQQQTVETEKEKSDCPNMKQARRRCMVCEFIWTADCLKLTRVNIKRIETDSQSNSHIMELQFFSLSYGHIIGPELLRRINRKRKTI